MEKYFEVKFQIFDKKLKVKVKASDEVEALDRVREALVVHSITKLKEPTQEDINKFNEIMNDFFDQINQKQ